MPWRNHLKEAISDQRIVARLIKTRLEALLGFEKEFTPNDKRLFCSAVMASEHSPFPNLVVSVKKRKLKVPRTPKACQTCRRRKIRCSGNHPCDFCLREEISCEYAGQPALMLEKSDSPLIEGSCPSPKRRCTEATYGPNHELDGNDGSIQSMRIAKEASQSRRSSLEPLQTFVHGTYVDPTSGTSFLHGQWSKGTAQDTLQAPREDRMSLPQAPLIAYGDLPLIDAEIVAALPEPEFKTETILNLLDRYFQYMSPTYRFHHHPTAKDWALRYVRRDEKLTFAQKACVLIICAQTLLHSSASQEDSQSANINLRMSMACSERAKTLLEGEPGPPSLASVLARMGMCLYFLSTFRLNECRYCFSFAVTVATALGIHRQRSFSSPLTPLEMECRKRAFWSLYVLDGYLCVMLGRPRMIRDEDIDQPFPQNIADDDLLSIEPVDSLPRHGNLEAFIAHAKLAKLMARGNDNLYPLYTLTSEQLLQRSVEMVDAFSRWEEELPDFLKPREHTMTGQRTFERQNTILKLAVAHARVLATRRCLLLDFGRKRRGPDSHSHSELARRVICEQCHRFFWATHYIALVAISTLYVLFLQGAHESLPDVMESFLDVNDTFARARKCHEYLATLPPSGTQAERHHVLLARLRSKVEESLLRRRQTAPRAFGKQNNGQGIMENATNGAEYEASYQQSRQSPVNNYNHPRGEPDAPSGNGGQPNLPTSDPKIPKINTTSDFSLFSFTTTPDEYPGTGFQDMLEFGWESLDTIGAEGNGQDAFLFHLD